MVYGRDKLSGCPVRIKSAAVLYRIINYLNVSALFTIFTDRTLRL